MSDDDLYLDSEYTGEKASPGLQKHQKGSNYDARRRLEERLEASRIQKQTQDYDFDLD